MYQILAYDVQAKGYRLISTCDIMNKLINKDF